MPTEKKQLLFNEGLTVGTYSPLIPFSCIFDINVGLITLIAKEYRSNIFNIDRIDKLLKDRRTLIYALYQRKFENPLLEFMVNPNYEEAEDMYQQFINQRYPDILDNSVHTGLYELCLRFAQTQDIRASIFYSKKEELALLQEDEDLSKVDFVDGKTVITTIDNYSQFFINSLYGKYTEELMKRLDHRNIYILDYKYNFDEKGKFIEAPSIIGFEAARNTLNIINAYDISRLRKE